jgi:N-acetylneuraminic acid mutarotase
VVGNSLYVIGGSDSHSGFLLNTVERATINPDGTLSSFVPLSGVTLAVPRQGHSSVVVGNSIYVLGGYGYNEGELGTIERATINPDGTLSSFSQLNNVYLWVRNAYHSSIVVGNSIYVIGGENIEQAQNYVVRATINSDGSISSFTPVAGVALNVARYGHATVVVGSSLYVFGGTTWIAQNSVERATINLDGTLSPFVTVGYLRAPRRFLTSLTVGDSIYAIGGSNDVALNTVERASFGKHVPPIAGLTPFAPVDGVTLGTPGAVAAVTVGKSIYRVGGYAGNGFLKTVESAAVKRNGTLSSFAPLKATLNTPRSSHTLVAVGNWIYAIGGNTTDIGPMSSVERATVGADGALSAFVPVEGLTGPRYAHSSVAIGNWLYVIGGASLRGTFNSVERAAIHPDGSLGPFALVPGVTLTRTRMNHSSLVVGGYLYVIGGYGDGSRLRSVERAAISPDGSLSTFATVSLDALITGRDSLISVTDGNSLWVIGGEGDNGTLASVERATVKPDGTISLFDPVDVALTTPRSDAAAVLIGKSLYVLGGYSAANGGRLNSLELSYLQ